MKAPANSLQTGEYDVCCRWNEQFGLAPINCVQNANGTRSSAIMTDQRYALEYRTAPERTITISGVPEKNQVAVPPETSTCVNVLLFPSGSTCVVTPLITKLGPEADEETNESPTVTAGLLGVSVVDPKTKRDSELPVDVTGPRGTIGVRFFVDASSLPRQRHWWTQGPGSRCRRRRHCCP